MNRKQLGILLVAVVISGGAGYLLHRKQGASWSSGGADVGKKLLGDFPVNDVGQIHVRQGTNELTLAKVNDVWTVRERHGYPADFSQISQLLLKLRDLKIVQSEEVGPSQLARLNLAAPGQGTNSAMVAEFSDTAGKPIRTIWLGKPHLRENRQPSPDMEGQGGWPDGRYVMTASNATTVAVISDPLTDVNLQPAQWLDKTFFKNEKAQSVAVSFPNATNSWKLSRASETNDWTLADAKPGEQLDETKASEAANALSSPSFTDVLNPQQGDFGQPTQIEIQDSNGFKYSIKVGAKTNDDYYLKIATSASFSSRTPNTNETAEQKLTLDKMFQEQIEKKREQLQRESQFNNWTYLVPGWVVDPLLKERSQLLVEKKEEPKLQTEATDTNQSAAPKTSSPEP